MTYNVLMGTLNPTYLLNHYQQLFIIILCCVKCLLQKGADVILIILQIDDLANVQLLSHLPLDKEYLWTLVPFLPNPMQWFNAIEHFGCSPPPVNVLPSYRHCKVSPGIIAPVILQGDNVPEQLQCDETSPLVTMEPDSYVDFDLAKAVFMRSAFWALPLFSRVAVKHRTEWNYVVQWLLFQTGHGLTTYLPRNYRKHVNNLPFPVAVVQLLSPSQCTSTFDKCIILQLRKLSSMRFVSDEFMDEVENWIIELTYAGYVFPIAKRQTDLNCSSIPVTWSPVLASAASKKPFVAVANVKHSTELKNQLCQPHRARKIDRSRFGAVVNLTHPWHQFRSILLVITFNKPHYDVIPYLELLYRSLFPHILYCGPSTLNTAGTPSLFEYRASFITYTEWPVHRTPGSVSYQCAIQVARMNFAVDGFLFTSDDLLLLPVPLARLREDRVWFVPANEIRVGDLETLRECRLGMCDFHPHWDWWETFRSATIETLNRMKQMSRSSALFYRCLAALREQNGVGRTQIRVNGAYSDIFYLPSRIAHSFADVAEVFADSGVFLEIAVPTVLRCLEPLVNFQALRGKDIQVQLLFTPSLSLCL